MILVDSSVWIDYFQGTTTPQTDRLDDLLGVELLLTGDIILTEVLQGFAGERDFNAAVRLMRSFREIVIGGTNIAIQAAARNFRICGVPG